MKIVSHGPPAVFQPASRTEPTVTSGTAVTERKRIERAILKTVLYSDIFDYPLTPDEVAHYIKERGYGKAQIRAILAVPVCLQGQVSQVDGFVTLGGREDLVKQRRKRALASVKLWVRARFYCRILSALPFIRMVGVTGALAMDNSDRNDDVDVLIVTEPERVWLARALAILVVYAGKLIGANKLCPNYVISRELLGLEPRTIYVAHEFVQMVPLFGFDLYREMRAANPWIEEMLPNADGPLHREPEHIPGRLLRMVKKVLERLLSGRTGDRIEAWEMQRKISKFASRAASSGSSVVLDRTQIKGHFDDHGKRITARYQALLRKYRLATLKSF